MTIRAIRDGDIPDAVRLLRALDRDLTPEAFEARLRKVLAATDHRVWIFEQQGMIVGVLHAFVRPALEKPVEVVVQSLAVDPAHRKAGIGAALMRHAEAWARATGHTSIALHTRHAAPFYKRIGYDEIAQTGLMRKQVT